MVCIRQRAPLTKFEKMWNSPCIAIEDPFDLGHNLGAGISRKSELEAYDNIGCEYFYIGNLTKAKFYNDKVCFGEIEMPGSIMRIVAV